MSDFELESESSSSSHFELELESSASDRCDAMSVEPQDGFALQADPAMVTDTPAASGLDIREVGATVEAKNIEFGFRWACRLFTSLRRLFGDDHVMSRVFRIQRRVSSHFSGVGTVEIATRVLAAAAQKVFRAPLPFSVAFGCDVSPACRSVLNRRLPGVCIYKDIQHRLPHDFINTHVRDGVLDYEGLCAALRCVAIARGAACGTHETTCAFGRVDVDVSGSPCTPWSRASRRRRGREDPVAALVLVWCAWLRRALPSIAVHENVVGFDQRVLEDTIGDLYYVEPVRMMPQDMGFPFLRRPRVYTFLFLKNGRGPPDSMQRLYSRIVEDLGYAVVGKPLDSTRAVAGSREPCSAEAVYAAVAPRFERLGVLAD